MISIKTVFYIFLFAVLSQDTFYFSSKPEDMDVIEGSEVLLRCDVSNRHHIVFSWAHNNKPLVPTSRRFQEGSHLHILRVTREEDSGIFSCIATNKTSGYSLVSEASLNIQCKYQKYTHGFICISLSSIFHWIPLPLHSLLLHVPFILIIWSVYLISNLTTRHYIFHMKYCSFLQMLLILSYDRKLTNSYSFFIYFFDSIMQSCTQQVSEN